MTDSIKVVCRFRRDKDGEELDDWKFEKETNTIKLREKKFNFDEILDMDTQQDEMYTKVASRCIEDFISGYHGTLFAYGNSGSGKTYSIVGPDEIVEFLAKDFSVVPENIQKLYGVIPRATIALFNAINEYTSSGATVSLTAAYIEIYNETVTCLLNGKNNLKIQEIPKVGFYINGNEQRPCTTPEDIFKVLYIGTKNKTVGGTLQNDRSSRSHTVLTLELKVKTVDGSERMSKLNIVDLAGSEKLRNTGANTPERIKEAQKINLSLTTLGMCIMALTENTFVPFRNSKLTLILKESLGGNSKTTLLCAARRDKKLVDDNLNSLGFAIRAKQIKTKCVKNVKLSDKENEYLITALKSEIVQLRKQVVELGKTFKPITDPKLLTLLDGDLKDDSTSISSTSEISNDGKTIKGHYVKRTSLINLSEEEIIYKYCELRAKYDNLIENAGNKIFELNKRASMVMPSSEQLEIINAEHKKELEAQKEENDEAIKKLEGKIIEIEKSKKKIEEELNTAKSDAQGLQEMLDLNTVDIETMSNDLTLKEEELNLAKLEREEALKVSESKIQEINSKDNYINDLLKQLKEMSDKKIEAENQAIALIESNKSKDLEIENLKADIERYKSLKTEDDKKIHEISEDNSKQNSKLLEANGKLKELENQILTKDSSIITLTSQVDNLKQLEKEKISDHDLFDQKDKLYNETKKILDDRINLLIDQNNSLTKENSESTNKFKNEISNLNNQINEISKKYEDSEFELRAKNSELALIKRLKEEQGETRDNEISKKTKDLNEIKLQLIEKEKEFQTKLLSSDEALISKDRIISEMETKCNLHTKEYEKNLKIKDSEILNLEKSKEELAKEKDELNSDKEKLKNEIESLNRKINEIKAQIGILQNTNKELTSVSFIILSFKNNFKANITNGSKYEQFTCL